MAEKQLGTSPAADTDAVTKGYVESAPQTLTNKTLANPTVTDYTESVVDLGEVGDTCTLSLSGGTVQTATLAASTITTFTMPTPMPGKSFVLMVKQRVATGGQGSAKFPEVRWPENIVPSSTPTAGWFDIFTFFSDGINWYGSYNQGYDKGEQDPVAGAKTAVRVPCSLPTYPVLRVIRRAKTGKRGKTTQDP